MRIKRQHRIVATGLAAFALCAACTAANAETSWTALSENCPDAESIVSQCRKDGLGIEESSGIIEPIRRATEEHLPCRLLLLKAEEGLSKGAAPESIAAAVQNRYRLLVQSREMIATRERAAAEGGLVSATALALESGVSEDTLRNLLSQGSDLPTGQMKHALEAAESLHLKGFSGPDVDVLIGDCLARNLRRSEMTRVVRYASQKHDQGMDSEGIRKSLWGKTHQTRSRYGSGGSAGGGMSDASSVQRPGGGTMPGPGSGGTMPGPGSGGSMPDGSPGMGGSDGDSPGPGPGGPGDMPGQGGKKAIR
ncbi:MAG: hypothetical protein KJ626_05730 [Verrucomicrobia bacterium]|nr:hypothetical protein [Verrucomicrobiota bacterium]